MSTKFNNYHLNDVNTGVEVLYDICTKSMLLRRGDDGFEYSQQECQEISEKILEKIIVSNYNVDTPLQLGGFLVEELIVDFMTRWLAR